MFGMGIIFHLMWLFVGAGFAGRALQFPAPLHAKPLIDGHNDFPIWIRAFYHNHIYEKNFSDSVSLYGQVDFPRLRQGGLTGQFWSVYVECPSGEAGFEDAAYYEIIHDTLQQIDLVYRLIEAFPRDLRHSTSVEDARKSEGKGVASFLGIEGLHQIGNSASVLRMYHRLGVSYASLTHTCHNKYADSEEPKLPLHHGLSTAGYDIIVELNRIGMMIDLSHTSWNTQRDVLAYSKAPVIYSHSSAYRLCPHSRNVPDDILYMLKENTGVVLVTFYPEFTNCKNKTTASLSDVADHIEYIGRLIGFEHVGIGSDFDGMPYGPTGLEDVSKYPDLLRELSRRGISFENVALVMGESLLRVLKEVAAVAKTMLLVKPLEDNVKSFF